MKTDFNYSSYQQGERYGRQFGLILGITIGLAITVATVFILTVFC
jgi:tetrahydromethanopterin S-methyltransferase subunit G